MERCERPSLTLLLITVGLPFLRQHYNRVQESLSMWTGFLWLWVRLKASCSYLQNLHRVPCSVQQAFPEVPHATLSTVLWMWTLLLPTRCHKRRNLSSLSKWQSESQFKHFLISESTSMEAPNFLSCFTALHIGDSCTVTRHLQAASDFLLWDSFLKGRITGSKSRSIFGVTGLYLVTGSVAEFCCVFSPFIQKVLTGPLPHCRLCPGIWRRSAG